MSLETREIKLFGWDARIYWDIPEVPEKFEKKKVFNFREVLHGVGADGVRVKFPIFAVNCSRFPLSSERTREKRRKTKKSEEKRRKAKKNEK